MKHLIFMLAFVATLACASCNKFQKSVEETVVPTDSIEIVDTVAIDTVAVDSIL